MDTKKTMDMDTKKTIGFLMHATKLLLLNRVTEADINKMKSDPAHEEKVLSKIATTEKFLECVDQDGKDWDLAKMQEIMTPYQEMLDKQAVR